MSEFRRKINYEQSALYDRQIRLWGIEAQNRMQNTSVLVVGFTGLHCEVIKNIVLAGVGVTIYDSKHVTMADLSSNFFFTSDDVDTSRIDAGVTRVKEYNDFVKVEGIKNDSIHINEEFLKTGGFSVVLLSDDVKEDEAIRINNIARKHSIPFFWSGAFGFEGHFICDFGINFQYKRDKPNDKDNHCITFPSLSSVLSTKWNLMQKKHFENISPTFVKARVISKFYDKHERKPIDSDIDEIKSLMKTLLHENDIDYTSNGSGNYSRERINDYAKTITSTASTGTFAVISAVVGGFLAQEILKAIQRSGEPMQNIFIYDGNDSEKNLVAKCFSAAFDTVTQPEQLEQPQKKRKTTLYNDTSTTSNDAIITETVKSDSVVLLD